MSGAQKALSTVAAAPAADPRRARRRARWAVAATALFSVAVNLLMLTGPVFMLLVYDRVLTSRSVPTLVVLVALVAALFAFLALFDFVRRQVMSRLGTWLEDALAGAAFAAWIGAGDRAVASPRPLEDLASVRLFLGSGGPLSLFDLPWTPIFLMVVFLLHPLLGLVALVGAVVLVALALGARAFTRGQLARSAAGSAAANEFALDAQRGAEALRALGMVGPVLAHWRAGHDAAVAEGTAAADRISALAAFTRGLRMFLQSAILATGAWLVLMGEATAGTMVAASIIMGRALAPIDQTIGNWRQIVATRDAWRRLAALLDAPAPPRATALPAPTGRLEVRGLVLAAPGGDRALLQGVSVALAPGDALGVIGPTGAGKSSLARALVGLWPPLRGEIRLDGASLDQYDPEILGRAVGYLPQEALLFTGTVRDNIARFDPDADDRAVVEAARRAHAHEMILKLPQGYKTRLGPGGAGLAGGQRQRVALARALYGDPALLVLDEPTANLDAEGEAALNKCVAELRERVRTVVLMTHRPGAIANVNLLLSLVGGRQVALGPRDEVLSKVLGRPARRLSEARAAAQAATDAAAPTGGDGDEPA